MTNHDKSPIFGSIYPKNDGFYYHLPMEIIEIIQICGVFPMVFPSTVVSPIGDPSLRGPPWPSSQNPSPDEFDRDSWGHMMWIRCLWLFMCVHHVSQVVHTLIYNNLYSCCHVFVMNYSSVYMIHLSCMYDTFIMYASWIISIKPPWRYEKKHLYNHQNFCWMPPRACWDWLQIQMCYKTLKSHQRVT